jgi:hypothetical protein
MMRVKPFGVLLLLLCGAGLPACDNRMETAPPWLTGEWHLAYNPLNDDADVLKFKPENEVAIFTEDGRQLGGHYLIRKDHLVLVIDKRGRSIETEFRISADKDRLTYKNGAYYTRAAGANSAVRATDNDNEGT